MKFKISKSQWETVGFCTGWLKTAQDSQSIIKNIVKLMEQEESYKQHNQDIPEMSEATPEDIDEGYGTSMSADEYKNSLNSPYVEILYAGNMKFKIYFFGNYEPSSVNAGRQKKIWMGEVDKNSIIEIINSLKQINVDVEVSSRSQEALSLK